MYRVVYLGVRLLAGLLVLAACSTAGRRGDTVILASGADLQSPNPLLTVHPLAKQVQRYVLLVTLVRYDSTLKPVPYLARRWSWSPDRTVLTLRLFTALRWHDGARTTAADVEWTLNTARAAETGYPRAADLARVQEVTATDDSTVQIRFSIPQEDIPDVFTDLAILPRHGFEGISPAGLRSASWNQRPTGNGPFRFVSHQPNRKWVFEANPDFPAELGGPPRLARFVIAVVDEPTTKLAALSSEELDFAGINPAHAQFVRRDARLAVLDYPLLLSYAIVFNTRRPPFDRLESRRAVAGAIDRSAVVDGVLFGYGTPSEDPVPPALQPAEPPSRRDAEPPSRRDAETPSRRDAETPSRRAGLLDFEVLTVGSGEAALEQLIQAQLARAGIRMRIRQLELATFLDRVQGPTHEFDAAVMGIPGDLALGYLHQVLLTSGLRWSAQEARLDAVIRDSVPATFLYHARGVQGMNRRVQGVRMDLRGELVTLHDWTVQHER
jgi:peptide/nickel transport system substrate-binding protein